jgi:hypothetical protein
LYSSSVHSSRPGRCFEVLTAKSSTVISCLVPPAVIAYYQSQSSFSPRSTERPQDAEYSPPKTAPSKMNVVHVRLGKVCHHFTYLTISALGRSCTAVLSVLLVPVRRRMPSPIFLTIPLV